MEFIKEDTEDVKFEEWKIVEVFSLKQEDFEEQTDLMPLKEESQDLNDMEEEPHQFMTGDKHFRNSKSEKTSLQSKGTRNIKRHMKIQNREKPFTCQQCGRLFCLKKSLNRHMKTHTGVKPFACQQCGRRFTEKRSLDSHMRIHTGEKPFICSQCEKSFIAKGSLKFHMRVHIRQKPYQFRQDLRALKEGSQDLDDMEEEPHQFMTGDKHFRNSKSKKTSLQNKGARNIKGHLKIKNGEKPFTCQQCGSNFSHKKSLNRHMKIHAGVKPFTCQQCGRRFTEKRNLDAHMSVHTGERPFICSQCEKSFLYKGTLKIHTRVHTGEKPYKCHQCERTFTYRSCLKRHLQTYAGVASQA